MRHLAIALLLAAPVHAGAIDPDAFAERYCALLQMGVRDPAATDAALRFAYDDNAPEPKIIRIGHVAFREDSIAAAEASRRRCSKEGE